ncbi:hypothetical protein GCM10009780_00210 [Actinomadura alba]
MVRSSPLPPREPPAPPRRRTPPTGQTITAKETIVTLPADRLSVRDRQAIDLADRLRRQIGQWLNLRGIITATVGISPYVDPADRPSVVICMNACAAQALLHDLGELQSGMFGLPFAPYPHIDGR